MSLFSRNNGQQGFSLLEIIAVVTVAAVLGAIVALVGIGLLYGLIF